jgi:urease subunit alpha
MPFEMDRQLYRGLYGPTTGDRIRLADTNLVIEIERDDASYGDEVLAGFGKTQRDGMLATSRAGRDSELDLLISNVVVLDPVLGVRKTSVGIKDGRIAGLGRAGNPDNVDAIDLVVGSNTGLITAEGLIATPGTVDSHVHIASTSLIHAALSAGTTTLVGMGYGGVWDQGVMPERNLAVLLAAFESIPINVAFLARGSSVDPGALERNVLSGCAGFKIHEDVAGFPEVIDNALTIADRFDIPVALHTDGLNESGELADTLAAINGRAVHAYHVEGAGGGHPNLLEIVSEPHILPSSTNPTLPYTVSTAAEHFDMIMTVHRLSRLLAEDVAAVNARIRTGTIAAESYLHDIGAISIMSSDSQGMGRIGEVVTRTWQTAHRMKELRGAEGEHDNARVLRYLAKYTLNPARVHGMDQYVGSLEPGKLADIVLWHPAFFGVKPQLVLKGGFVAWGIVGDGNASIRVAEPLIYRPMFGALGRAPAELSIAFTSQAALDDGLRSRLRLTRQLVPLGPTRGVRKVDLLFNSATPKVEVDPRSPHQVTVDGTLLDVPPAEALPMTQRYFAL